MALRGLCIDTELNARRDAFLREQDLRIPRLSRRNKDALGAIAALTALLLSFFYAVQLVFLREFAPLLGMGEVLLSLLLVGVIGLMIAVPLIWLVVRCWPARRDPFREHCARLPSPPALGALDAEQRERLSRSVLYTPPWERREETWVDSGGAF